MAWRIFKYMAHLFHSRNRKGHGIHSPYLFDFVNGVLFNAKQDQLPGWMTTKHTKLRSENAFVKKSSVSGKYGFLLFRITRWFRPDMIIELGTGMGVSTLYLSLGAPQVPLHSAEEHSERAAQAAALLSECCSGSVSVHQGDIEDVLDSLASRIPERFLAFVDGNHHYEPSLAYVRKLLDRAGDESLIIMDDIYWSKGMQRAWKEVISWPEVRVSIDLFHMGILLLRKDLHKKDFKIKF